MKDLYRLPIDRWTVTRTVYAVAGTLVAASVLLGIFAHPGWHYVTLFVGVMLAQFALTGWCPMAIILHRLGLPRG